MAKMPDLPPVSGGHLQTTVRTGNVPSVTFFNDMDLMTEDDLLVLRAEIDQRLPTRKLKDVNIETELVRQMAVAMKLQRETLDEDSCPANQKSQVLNAAAASITALGKLQVEIYNSERLKTIEACLIECLQELPTPQQEAFLGLYMAKLDNPQPIKITKVAE